MMMSELAGRLLIAHDFDDAALDLAAHTLAGDGREIGNRRHIEAALGSRSHDRPRNGMFARRLHSRRQSQ